MSDDKGTSLDSLGKADRSHPVFRGGRAAVGRFTFRPHLQYSLAYNRAIALEKRVTVRRCLERVGPGHEVVHPITKSGERVQGTLPVSRRHLLVQKSKTLNRMARTGESIKLCKEALRLEPDLYDAIRAMGRSVWFRGAVGTEAIRWNDRHMQSSRPTTRC